MNIKTSVLHRICSFCTNFVKFFRCENIENHLAISWQISFKFCRCSSYWAM